MSVVAIYTKLAKDLVSVLEKKTGSVWTVEIRDSDTDADHFYGAFLTRADGFRLFMRKPYHKTADRAEFSISWPRDPEGGARCYRDAPGVRYNATSPTTTVDPKRSAEVVANQIIKILLADEIETAYAAMITNDKSRQRLKDSAKIWRETVTTETGIDHKEVNGHIWWGKGFGEIKSNPMFAGGSITIDLPDDPVRAAKILKKMQEFLAE